MSKWQKILYRCLGGAIFLTSLVLLFTVPSYRFALSRLGEALGAFGRSVAYLFCDLLGLSRVPEQTLNNPITEPIREFAGINFTVFFEKVRNTVPAMFHGQHFILFLSWLFYCAVRLLCYGCYVFLFGILCYIPILIFSDETNNDYAADTKPLELFKRLVARPVTAVIGAVADFCRWFRQSAWFGLTALTVSLALNIWTVLLAFFAWYFYFLVTVEIGTVPVQLEKLYYDVMLFFRGAPAIVFVIAAVWLFLKWRRERALDLLRHMERKNSGLQNDLPMCIFFTAPPRTGKTTMITSMALTFSAEFRRAALDLMEKNALRFPRFPWILLEKDLQAAIAGHWVYNLATVRQWVDYRAAVYEDSEHPDDLWGYEGECLYNDNLWVKTLWEILGAYCQEYFIYFLETSLLVGNYSVREDYLITDGGNFPLIDDDFFDRDPWELPEQSHFAHIIDFDMCRLGRKMVQENAHSGGLEFGVILISEIDKELKNDLKLKDEDCNQKNDLFNEWLKMAGHAATVDGYCFLRVLSDAQRPSSWGADARELSTVAHVLKKGEPANALALFWVEDALISRFVGWFLEKHREERFHRGDNTLLGWVGIGLAGALAGYRERRVNLYGYRRQPLELEAGTLDNVTESKDYAITYKKVYSHRFGTDCFKAISETQAQKCPTGLNDLAAYGDIYPTFEELEQQNSHFQKDMFQYYEIDPEEPNDLRKLPHSA